MSPRLDRLMTRLRLALPQARTRTQGTEDRVTPSAPPLRVLFEASPIGMAFARDRQCMAIAQNPAMDRMLGPAGADRSKVRMLHHDQALEPAQWPLQRAAELGMVVPAMELEIAIEGQPARHVIAHAMPLLDPQGRQCGAIMTLVDITERKRIELQAEQARQRSIDQALASRLEAENANRATVESLTLLGHELRNPLGAITAAAQVLETPKIAADTINEARAIIVRQTANLTHTMNNLFDIGRVIAGEIPLSRHPTDLSAVAQRVAGTLATAPNHRLQCDLQAAWVDGDAVRLEQIFNDLLARALKASSPDGQVALTVRRDGDLALIEVRETGARNPAPALSTGVAGPAQGDCALAQGNATLGQATALVRRLTALHGGTVGFVSSSAGSICTVSLPAIAPAVDGSAAILSPARRRNVLLVEDRQETRTALRASLEREGHSVHTTPGGRAGLSRLLRLKPDVVLVDIGLIGSDGLDLARDARAAGYAGRMIAMVEPGPAEHAASARAAGYDGFLAEPIDCAQLHSSLTDD